MRYILFLVWVALSIGMCLAQDTRQSEKLTSNYQVADSNDESIVSDVEVPQENKKIRRLVRIILAALAIVSFVIAVLPGVGTFASNILQGLSSGAAAALLIDVTGDGAEWKQRQAERRLKRLARKQQRKEALQ